jgi:hypothetical protein
MDPVGQIAKIAFEVLPVRFHRHPVYLGPPAAAAGGTPFRVQRSQRGAAAP